jgi:hypothetical protein
MNSARCPMAICGVAPMPQRPGSHSRISLPWVACSSASVVHDWPLAFTYCRSSAQMEQCAGGVSDGTKPTPQVVQMNDGMGCSQV